MSMMRFVGERYSSRSVAARHAKIKANVASASHDFLLPWSPSRHVWDLVTLFAVLLVATFTPYELAFTSQPQLFFINRTIDIIFFVDLLLNFVTAYEKAPGFYEYSRKAIARHYLRGWFVLDFIASIPYEIPALVAAQEGGTGSILQTLSLLRLLRLLRLVRGARMAAAISQRLHVSFGTLGLLKYGIIMGLVSHWMACVWVAAGRAQGYRRTWLSDPGYAEFTEFQLYGVSLYWAAMTLTSIGYGDVTANNILEHWVCTACMLLGGSVWAYIVGSSCSILATVDVGNYEFRQRMDELNLFMEEHNCIPDATKARVRTYVQNTRDLHRRRRHAQILLSLSPSLQRELAYSIYGATLQRIQYLRHLPHAFLVYLALKLSLHVFAPHEPIVGIHLHIVSRGLVGRKGFILRRGDYWGEENIILDTPALHDPAPGIALTYTELQVITRHDLVDVIQDFPDSRKTIRSAQIRLAFRRAVRKIGQTVLRSRQQQLPRHSILSIGEGSGRSCPDTPLSLDELAAAASSPRPSAAAALGATPAATDTAGAGVPAAVAAKDSPPPQRQQHRSYHIVPQDNPTTATSTTSITAATASASAAAGGAFTANGTPIASATPRAATATALDPVDIDPITAGSVECTLPPLPPHRPSATVSSAAFSLPLPTAAAPAARQSAPTAAAAVESKGVAAATASRGRSFPSLAMLPLVSESGSSSDSSSDDDSTATGSSDSGSGGDSEGNTRSSQHSQQQQQQRQRQQEARRRKSTLIIAQALTASSEQLRHVRSQPTLRRFSATPASLSAAAAAAAIAASRGLGRPVLGGFLPRSDDEPATTSGAGGGHWDRSPPSVSAAAAPFSPTLRAQRSTPAPGGGGGGGVSTWWRARPLSTAAAGGGGGNGEQQAAAAAAAAAAATARHSSRAVHRRLRALEQRTQDLARTQEQMLTLLRRIGEAVGAAPAAPTAAAAAGGGGTSGGEEKSSISY